MPFDPNIPVASTEIDAVQMRAQLNGLKDLIDAVPTIYGTQVDSVTTGLPTDPAGVTVSLSAGVLHFSFLIPQGVTGEVSNATLAAEIAGTARNSATVAPLVLTVSDPPTQAEVQSVVDKLNELIAALAR